MRGKTSKFLRKCIIPYPHKLLIAEFSKIYGEEKVLSGDIKLGKKLKLWWNRLNHKERKIWKRQLV